MMATTVVILKDEDSTVRVYTKGAPEILLHKCSKYYNKEGNIQPLQEKVKHHLLGDYCVTKMGKDGDKLIAIAYKDIALQDFDRLQKENNGFRDERDKEKVFECDMTLISIVSIRDELRERVNEVVQ